MRKGLPLLAVATAAVGLLVASRRASAADAPPSSAPAPARRPVLLERGKAYRFRTSVTPALSQEQAKLEAFQAFQAGATDFVFIAEPDGSEIIEATGVAPETLSVKVPKLPVAHREGPLAGHVTQTVAIEPA